MTETLSRRIRTGRIYNTQFACTGVLIVFPLLLLAVNQSFAYPLAGWLDPWIYTGYHVHFASMWHFSPGAYYGTRVPYTALGAIFYHIAGAEPSLYLLVLAQLYVAAFSLYIAIRLLFDSPVAGLVAACLLGTNSWFLWAIGWHYVDGPSIACMLFSIAALATAARSSRWRLASVLWGAGMAATATLYLMYAVLLPVEILTFIMLNRLWFRRALLPVALFLCAGFVGAIVLMSSINWGLGGRIDFWTPTFALMFELGSSKERALYYAPWHTWIWSASWLLFPAFAALASAALLAVRGVPVLRHVMRLEVPVESAGDGNLITVALACVLAVGGFAFMQALHFNTLQVWYHENILWSFAFLFFGGCIATGLSRVGRPVATMLAIIAPMLCIAPWIAGAEGWLRVPLPYGPQVGAPVNSLLLPATLMLSGKLVEPIWMIAGAALLLGATTRWSGFFALGAVAFLSFMSTATIQSSSNVTMRLDPAVRDRTLSIYDVASAIDASRDGRPIFLWWRDNDPALWSFQSLGVMYILNPYVPPVIDSDARVVFLTSDGGLDATEASLLKRNHMKAVATETKHIRRGSIDIEMAIAKLEPMHQ